MDKKREKEKIGLTELERKYLYLYFSSRGKIKESFYEKVIRKIRRILTIY